MMTMRSRKDEIASVILDALDTQAALLNAKGLLCGLRLDVKFNRQGHPVKVIIWPEAEYFAAKNSYP